MRSDKSLAENSDGKAILLQQESRNQSGKCVNREEQRKQGTEQQLQNIMHQERMGIQNTCSSILLETHFQTLSPFLLFIVMIYERSSLPRPCLPRHREFSSLSSSEICKEEKLTHKQELKINPTGAPLLLHASQCAASQGDPAVFLQ